MATRNVCAWHEELAQREDTSMALVKPTWGEVFEVPPTTTADDLLRLPDDGYQYELYEGMVVRGMTFAGHGNLCHRLDGELYLYARSTGFANRIVQNTLIDLTPPGAATRTVLAPDLAILRTTTPPAWNMVVQDPPLLAVEVVSESQTLAELTLKAQVYRQAGVEEVWVIDHKSRAVDVWNAQGTTILNDSQNLTSTLLPGFTVSVRYLLDG
jgi:Uma2 family endonuclease